jgi:hypothetical protein
MKRGCVSFNIYFVLTVLVLAAGCASDKESQEEKKHKKEQSTIRLYMESAKADSMTAGSVLVTRQKFPYVVDREPFLTEEFLGGAKIIDDPNSPGSYSIELQFNDHGALLLELYTASNIGKHIIVFAQFPTPGLKAVKAKKELAKADEDENLPPAAEPKKPEGPRQSAWLAAVTIRKRLVNGSFSFTPDASRSEGVRIVRGLKNVVTKGKKDSF